MWDVVRIAPRACMRNNVEQRSGCSEASSRFSDFCMAEKRKPRGIGRTRVMTGGWLKGSSCSSPSSTSLPHIIIISRLFATWAAAAELGPSNTSRAPLAYPRATLDGAYYSTLKPSSTERECFHCAGETCLETNPHVAHVSRRFLFLACFGKSIYVLLTSTQFRMTRSFFQNQISCHLYDAMYREMGLAKARHILPTDEPITNPVLLTAGRLMSARVASQKTQFIFSGPWHSCFGTS